MKITEIFEHIESHKLVLPDFQREFEWVVDKQRGLLASFMTGLPIGSLLLLKGTSEDFAAKDWCMANKVVSPNPECLYVLDGQQRISTLKVAFTDLFHGDDWGTTWDRLYRDLRVRWCVRIKPANDEEDVWGWEMLKFKGLHAFEPDDLRERIVPLRILKTKNKDKWYHPAYRPTGLTGAGLRNSIAEEAAQEVTVPLYSLGEETQYKLHERVLGKIAKSRVDALKAKVMDGELSVTEVLSAIDPDVAERQDDVDYIEELWNELQASWWKDISQYLTGLLDQALVAVEVPSNEIGRAISIFENINSNPMDLDTFDLVNAKSTRDRSVQSLAQRVLTVMDTDIELPSALTDDHATVTWRPAKMGSLSDGRPTKIVKKRVLDLLAAFARVQYGDVDHLRGENIKAKSTLSLLHTEINDTLESVLTSLTRALAFLQYRCGIIDIENLPYELMLLPMAYVLKDDGVWNSRQSLDYIEYWYWATLLGGGYRESQNERCLSDIRDLYKWIHGQIDNPFSGWYDKVLADSGYSDLEVLLGRDARDVPSAVHKGILQYVLSNTPVDFRPGDPLRLKAWEIAGDSLIRLEDHHIWPLGAATRLGESTTKLRRDKDHILNSPLNRTYISREANNQLRDKTPDEYFRELSELIVRDHCLDSAFGTKYQRRDDETDEERYVRLLTERYRILKGAIKAELSRMLPS